MRLGPAMDHDLSRSPSAAEYKTKVPGDATELFQVDL